MTNIVIQLFENIKVLVFKKDNITFYYNGFNELLNLMEMAIALDKDDNCVFTYVVDHETEETNKLKYHEGINAEYSDEGHYHFERKDKGKISVKDVVQLLDYLIEYNLLNNRDKSMVIKMYRDKKSTQRKLSVFSHVSEKDSVSSYVERDLSYNPM
ncbi:hypothetical protein ACTAZI_04660 [Legionella bozemanae]|uniref:hypothetical protein n=1 Tax=Legionella bozemanae TaxID=447 RepID=UPI001041B4D9|nr:hypothetical protein [Legionella bozemanae]